MTETPADGVGLSEIALAIGISPRLLGILMHKPEPHYRTFEILKANGTPRGIQSPRTMLKVVQHFLLDYFIRPLPVHQAATAYSPRCTIKANASPHVGKRYVANIDVSNFFPSLRTEIVYQKLVSAGLRQKTAVLVARLTSYKGGLPQGAPTSAALSNICMFDFDQTVDEASHVMGVQFTRYADDITFSGDELAALHQCIAVAQVELAKIGLSLNASKTRIFGPASRQTVTGVVVNERAQPPRSERRKLRATLHRATQDPAAFVERLNELQGRAGYMLSFAEPGLGVGGLPRAYVLAALTLLRERTKQLHPNGQTEP